MGTIEEDYTIWLVDDEQQVLDNTKAFLSLLGYKVLTFIDPFVAEQAIESEKNFVLLIVDHDFSNSERPSYTGYDFSHFVKQNYFLKRATPIIYLTGREKKSNFENRQLEFPDVVPNIFLAKNEIALNVELLENSVKSGFDYLEELERKIDEHGLSLALEMSSDWRF